MLDIANILFTFRNGNRAQNGEGGRGLVTVGQAAKFFKQVQNYDNVFGDMTKSTINAFKQISESDKTFKYISKGVKFASENVNPLICLSSGINVLTSDDKQTAIISEAGNLAGMFAMEGWMKKHLDGIIEKLPISKKWKPIVRGIAFVCGSIGASTLCYKLAKKGAEKLKEQNEKYKNISMQPVNDKFKPKNLAYSA
jgi:hypothetical protein